MPQLLTNPYIRLMRLHQPTGIWLLLWPCWWALALASHGNPPLRLLALFGVGAVVMRSAGCVMNDLADREIDRKVERTRLRPLASGELSPGEAIVFLLFLLCIAFLIALQLPLYVLGLAAGSLVLVATYPFMKRLTWWPQAFLGLTFNWGALMGVASVKGEITLPALLLYAGCFFWTLGYDTIYAHQDKEDDRNIGVKSTALRLGENKIWLAAFYAAAVGLWAACGWYSYATAVYFMGLTAVAGHMIWQIMRVDLNDTQSCRKTFRSNTMLGWIFFAGTGAINAVYYTLALYARQL